MNTNMNVTIRRLTNAFIIFFLVLSGVAAYIQINNQAFFNGPALAAGKYDPRQCPPYDQPVRGTIYDIHGKWLARSVPDPQAVCGYRREYSDPTLAPLIGYYSNKYGTAGLEASYNDQLALGEHCYVSPQDAAHAAGQDAINKLLHKPRYGCDIYLTIDDSIQQYANHVYDSSYISGQVCQAPGSHPAGSIIVEDPNTGEIRAMVSRPYFDPNKIDDPAYWQQINSDPGAPLINHATLASRAPGSTFKTMTLLAALDSGYPLTKPFSFDEATNFHVPDGKTVRWDDYFNGTWKGLVGSSSFPLTMEQGFAYSDNAMFARVAYELGKDNWLGYLRRFGIATPGTDVAPVPFDAPFNQSSAYPAIVNGKPYTFSDDDLADAGFGQGPLQISPLTMAEITSAIAADGVLWEPHVVLKVVPHGTNAASVLPVAPVAYNNGAPAIRPETAQSARHAMWSVASQGTGWYGLPPHNGYLLKTSPVHEGGKTGTAQLGSGAPDAWWISLAPDDQAPGGSQAKYIIVVNKLRSGEGACQVYVADDIYRKLLGV